jgi:hypothetical protein
MNIFNNLKVYAGKWSLKSSRDFTEEEIKSVSHAEVVPSQYGNSVCFTMINGGKTFIPLSNDSSLGVGESVDITKAKLLTLGKDGECDINRVAI